MVAGESQARPPEAETDRLDPQQIADAIGGRRVGAVIRYEARVDSTNRLARDLGRRGAEDGLVVVADEQTAGRGRRRRDWASPAGLGLYVTVLLRPSGAAAEVGAAVQLVAGIAVAETLVAHCSRPLVLRWPNDCYCGDRKLAGVLVESDVVGGFHDFLVCGMGLNLNHEESDFPAELRGRATSLRMLSGRLYLRLPLLLGLLDRFQQWDDVWRARGMGPIIERWLELSPESRGSHVEVRTDRGPVSGIADGLSPSGGLYVIDDEHGRREITVGELVRLSPATAEVRRRLP